MYVTLYVPLAHRVVAIGHINKANVLTTVIIQHQFMPIYNTRTQIFISCYPHIYRPAILNLPVGFVVHLVKPTYVCCKVSRYYADS